MLWYFQVFYCQTELWEAMTGFMEMWKILLKYASCTFAKVNTKYVQKHAAKLLVLTLQNVKWQHRVPCHKSARLHRGRGIAAERWTEKVLGEPANGAELFLNKQPYRVLKTAVGKRTVFLKELE